MPAAVAIFTFVVLIAFAHQPLVGGGWTWDAANAFGLAAYCGLLILALGIRGANARKPHEALGYAALALCFAHGYLMILTDAALGSYLRPGAPLYMWAGVIALLAVAFLVVSARQPDRSRIHRNYASFHRTHLLVSYVALTVGGYHILASGFYFSTPVETALAAAGTAAFITFRKKIPPGLARPPSLAAFAALAIVATIAFVLIRDAV